MKTPLWLKLLFSKKKVSVDYSTDDHHDYTVKTTYKVVDGVIHVLRVETIGR